MAPSFLDCDKDFKKSLSIYIGHFRSFSLLYWALKKTRHKSRLASKLSGKTCNVMSIKEQWVGA